MRRTQDDSSPSRNAADDDARSLQERAGVPETRLGLAHSATGSNAGPSHTGAPSPEDNDVFTGTSSGSSLRGKPHKGSREDIGM